MSGAYGALAPWYDSLTVDIPYEQFADYYEERFRRHGTEIRTVLDLCCGTGTLSCILAERGYEMICTDASPDMLAMFREKCAELPEETTQPLLLCQAAEELDLYGTVDAVVCSLDGFNYFPPEMLPEIFRRLRLFIAPGGLLLFDVHSPERLRSLDKQCFVDETEELLCLWRSHFDEEIGALIYGMDIFTDIGDECWAREQEEHIEYSHEPEELLRLLTCAGFGEVRMDKNGPHGTEGRIFIEAIRL